MVVTEGAALRGLALLSTAAALWLGNLVVFALWYWLLDRGGPEVRLSGISVPPDLQFPAANATYPEWTPDFIDYVFVAFNTSIAFSPTDTTPVTTRAKLIMMAQALLSLVTLAVAVARAVNILE